MALLPAAAPVKSGGLLAWAALLVGAATSIAANVAAAQPTFTGRAVAAWPPVALALAYELFLRQIGRESRDRKRR